jgi:hypothetical protein
MQKRHFELIAASIHRSLMASNISGTAAKKEASTRAIRLVATDVAASCAAVNPNFDKARFMAACGF